MGGGKREVTAKLGLDGKQAQEQLGLFKKLAQSSFTEINQAVELAGKAWGKLSGAVGVATDFIAESVKAASESEAAERRLVQALQLRGQFTEDALESMKAFASEVQRKTTIDDDSVIAMQSQLAALGVSKEKMNEAAKATIGLSEVTGKGLNNSARIVAQVIRDGTAPALKKLGLEGKTSAETLANLTANFKLAEDKATTFEGRTAQLKNTFGDLQENIGATVIQSGAAKNAMGVLNGALGDLSTFFAGPEGKEAVNEFFGFIVSCGADVVDVFGQIIGAVDQMAENFRRHMADLRGDAVFITDSEENAVAARLRKLAGELRAASHASVSPGLPAGDSGNAKVTAQQSAARSEAAKKAREQAAKDAAEDSRFRAEQDEARWAQARADNDAQLDLLRQFEEQKAAFVDERRRQDREMEKEASEAKFQDELAAYDRRLDAQKKSEEEKQKVGEQFASIGLGALSNTIASVTQALAEGDQSAGDIAKSLTGGVISALGNLLIQLGTAAVVAGGIGTAIPLLFGVTGGPAGVALGLGAIAAGSVMVGLGGALSHSGGPSAARVSGAGPRGRSGFAAPSSSGGFDSGTRGFALGFGTGGGSITNVTNVNVQGFVVGSDRGLARELGKVLRAGDTLAVGAR